MTLVGKSRDVRTDCPDQSIATMEQLLQLPAVLAGNPQVFADQSSLNRHIGWVHVLENSDPRTYLRGQELVLTTGIGWGPETCFEKYVAELVELESAGLLLELGNHCPAVPAALIQSCKEHCFPLVALHEPVAFVEITEALHQLLFSSQTRRIEAGGEVTAHFTALMQLGAPAETILRDCARLLNATVVLEDSGYNVLRHASAVPVPADFFEHWQDRSRSLHVTGNAGRQVIPVQIHGRHFGSLIAPDTATHPAGSLHVLTMAGIALGTELLRKQEPASLAFDTACELLDDLMLRKDADSDLLAGKFEASGFPVRHRQLRGFAIPLASCADLRAAARQIERTIGKDLRPVIGARNAPASKLFGFFSAIPGKLPPDWPQTLHLDEVAGYFDGPLYLGAAVNDFGLLADSIRQAIGGCELSLAANQPVVLAEEYPLALLAHELRHEPAMQRLPQQVLAPILALDPARRTECLRVLKAYLASPTNRSQAATRCQLSRSVFYQRLGLLESLLDMDLNDAQSLTVLSLGLAVYQQNVSA